MSAIKVSVVIPTLNSMRTLESCLTSVRANRSKYPYEIIVVDAGSQDGTVATARKFADKVIDGVPFRINRNLGIERAEGDIICFTDSDCTVPEHWIDGLVDGLLRLNQSDIHIVGVGGGNLPVPDYASPVERAISIAMRSPLISFKARNTATYADAREVTHNPTLNAACFKRVVQEVGGFREEPGFPEDLDLDARIIARGYRLYYLPDLNVLHKHKTDYKKFSLQMADFGRKRIKGNREHRHIARFYHYGPLVLVLMLYSPLFFIPLCMAFLNGLYASAKEKDIRLLIPVVRLTLSFYRNYGSGQISALLKAK